ncbi:MAG TPA: carbon-nitrogen hydrolase family protein [Thermoanaerobaculia bacterium]|nr:carbon-nitrogen hydrolase family protein [Thermoanaerobaculia bacterium]
MIVALASPRVASSLEDGLERVERALREAAAQGARIVCFPEAYLPGLRGLDFEVPPFERADQERVLRAVAQWSRLHAVAVVLGMERVTEAGRQIAAFVLDDRGELQGVQTKNQLDPSEEWYYVPGRTRRIFEVDGVEFGVAICHEGWRYPETVRWAAVRGAKIVFHPQHTGSEREGVRPTEWGAPGGAYLLLALGVWIGLGLWTFVSFAYLMALEILPALRQRGEDLLVTAIAGAGKAALYFAAVVVAMVIPVPRLGVTPEVEAELGLDLRGVTDPGPQNVLLAGVAFFAILAFVRGRLAAR